LKMIITKATSSIWSSNQKYDCYWIC